MNNENPDVLIIGAGLAGLCAAIRCQRAGLSYQLLERASEVGGTWRDNTYPGCACDIPSLVYSFSFAPNDAWTRSYPKQPEIQAYILNVVQQYKLQPHIALGCDVEELRWEESANLWRAHCSDGREYAAKYLIVATGALNKPDIPNINGLSTFTGPQFHSMQWQHDVPLAGKRVAVIGTGASAIQFVPEIAKTAAQVTVYQRTAPWIIPRPDMQFGKLRKLVYRHVPGVQRAHRWLLYWTNESLFPAFKRNPAAQRMAQRYGLWHLKRQVSDESLREKLTPKFEPGCKRILVSNDWYPALSKPHVELVTDGISHVTENSVVTADGKAHTADVIILGTGFRLTDFLLPMKVYGRNGLELAQHWRDHPAKSYLGIMTAQMPNLFLLVGPNTGLGHNSIIFMIEAQMNFVIKAITHARQSNITQLEITPQAQEQSYADVQSLIKNTVWQAGGCKSYYQRADGSNDALWPDYTWRYWLKTRQIRWLSIISS